MAGQSSLYCLLSQVEECRLSLPEKVFLSHGMIWYDVIYLDNKSERVVHYWIGRDPEGLREWRWEKQGIKKHQPCGGYDVSFPM